MSFLLAVLIQMIILGVLAQFGIGGIRVNVVDPRPEVTNRLHAVNEL